MKTQSLFFAALVMISSAAFAEKDKPGKTTGMAVVPVKDSQVVKLIYSGETTGAIKLNIYNKNRSLILSQIFRDTHGFICPLNFTGLGSGEYVIEVIDNAGVKNIQKVVINRVPVTNKKITPESTVNAHVSRLKTDEAKFLLSVVSNEAQEISIQVYDDQSNLLHTERHLISGDFAQVFKIENTSKPVTLKIVDAQGNAKRIRL